MHVKIEDEEDKILKEKKQIQIGFHNKILGLFSPCNFEKGRLYIKTSQVEAC